MNRREFLSTSTAGAAAMMFSGCKGSSPSRTATSNGTTRPIGANDDIRVAVVGFNAQGKAHIRAYQQMPGVRLVALCDVDEKVLQTQADALAKENIKVQTYRDIRKLLDSKEVDAISCALPNRWHSLAAVWACQAGKDACIEKPVSHCIWEGRKAALAARKYGRMVAVALNNRSRPALDAAFAYIQSGQLGKITHARVWDFKRRETMGKVIGPQRIPEHLDYNLWVGPGPMLPLTRTKLHYDWHWQWATGNGEIANNGSHHLDMVRWALGKPGLPTTVMSFGGRYGYIDDGQTPNTQVAVYDYGGIPVVYESRGLPEKLNAKNMPNVLAETADGKPVIFPHKNGNHGIAVFCEGGYYHDAAVFDNDGKEIQQFEAGKTDESSGARRAQANFINAVRTRRIADLKTDIEQGHLTAVVCHMGNCSFMSGGPMPFDQAKGAIGENVHAVKALDRMRDHLTANGVDLANTPITVGPMLTMDSKAERFIGDDSERGNLFLKDSYRAPFVIPETV